MWAARLALLVCASACDFTPAPPAPKTQPQAQPQPPTQPQAAAQPAARPAPPDAGPPLAPPPVAQEATADFVTHDCLDAAAHVVDVTLAAIADPNEKVIQGRKRATMTRQTAEECSKHPWSADAIRCFGAAETVPKLRDCDKLIK